MKKKNRVVLISLLVIGFLLTCLGLAFLFLGDKKEVEESPQEALLEEVLAYEQRDEYSIFLDLVLESTETVTWHYQFDYHPEKLYIVTGTSSDSEEPVINGYVDYQNDVWTKKSENGNEVMQKEITHPHDIFTLLKNGANENDHITVSKETLTDSLFYSNLYPLFGSREEIVVAQDSTFTISKDDLLTIEGTISFTNGFHLSIKYKLAELVKG